MKKIFFYLFSIFFLIAYSTEAQQTSAENKIVVNVNDLTPDQLLKIQKENDLKEIQVKVENYGKWVGVGKEIGIAVKDGLNAVVDVADRFEKTDVGRFTIYMIAWKIIGKDLFRLFVGILIGIFLTFFMFYAYKCLYVSHKVRTKGSWYQFWITKEYKIITPNNDWEGY